MSDDDGSHIDRLAVAASRMVERIREEMRDTWRLDDQLLEKFFPVDPSCSKFSRARKKLFNDDKRYKRWKGFAGTTKSASSLHRPLMTLMNGILFHYGIPKEQRLFLDTHIRHVSGFPQIALSPGIWLAGIGTEFATTKAEAPRAFYPSGISAVEVSLDSQDLSEARDRLAVHMHRIFQHQDNRRFAYGLVITQSIVTVYMFDHSGAVASEPLKYHEHPERFCAIISGLASEKDRIGFDSNVFREGICTHLRMFQQARGEAESKHFYRLRQNLFQFSSLVGRGTICWLTSALDDPKATFVVKDAWIAPAELPGRESEGSLLRHAQLQGVVAGVAQVRHFEEVRRGANASDLDTVLRNRKVEDASTEAQKLNRVHTRIILETHGKTLDKFATRKELLLAFHDAVVAHRKLHDVAGILHRDISVRNILINTGGDEGDRGILIDFDHAIRVGDTSPYSTKRKIGTWRYMSRNVLDAEDPHTYLDDLESFYYVWCWVLVAWERPGAVKAELPRLLSVWDEAASSVYKNGLLLSDFSLPVAPWFGKSLHRLAVHLHHFFQSRLDILRDPLSSPDPDPDPAHDYDEFLTHIRQCITELEGEPEPTEDSSSVPLHGHSKSHESVLEPAEPASGDRRRITESDEKREHEPESISDWSLSPDRDLTQPRESANPASRKQRWGRYQDSDNGSLRARSPRRHKLRIALPPPIPFARPRRAKANYGVPAAD